MLNFQGTVYIRNRITYSLPFKGGSILLVNPGSVLSINQQYVDMHYAENINRNLLSNIFYLDPDYASRLFKKETGRTFGSYVIECRINSAKKLLKDTDLPVSAISGNVGYPDYSYFIRIFKKITGVTPNDYRNSKDWDAL